MSDPNPTSTGCWKIGCIGVVAMGLVLVALIAVGLAARSAYDSAEAEVEEREVSHPLPPPPVLPSALAGEELGGGTTIEAADFRSRELSGVNVGRIVLDLSVGEFFITPGPADEPLRIEAEFDSRAFELEEDLTSSESGWTYEVSFRTQGWLRSLLRGVDGDENRVELIVPRGQPVDIVGRVGVGQSEIDLSGLWLREVDLDLGTGQHSIYFREPTPLPMESFRLKKSVGELEVYNLGDASPAMVQVEQKVGNLKLSLEGDWLQDAEVEVDFGIGECRIDLPETARVELDRSRMAIGERDIDLPDNDLLPSDAPLIRLGVESKIGELRIR